MRPQKRIREGTIDCFYFLFGLIGIWKADVRYSYKTISNKPVCEPLKKGFLIFQFVKCFRNMYFVCKHDKCYILVSTFQVCRKVYLLYWLSRNAPRMHSGYKGCNGGDFVLLLIASLVGCLHGWTGYYNAYCPPWQNKEFA